MKIKLIIFLCILFNSNIHSYSQKTFKNKRSKRLCPIQIDTLNEAILIIEKSSSFVYFKQSDIFEYLKGKPDSLLLDFLNPKREKIYFRDFWWDFNYTKEEKENYYKEDSEKKRLDQLFFTLFNEVGAELIFNGKFMILDKPTKKGVSKKLKMKRVKHKLGQLSVHFKLPSGEIFWYALLRLGE